jgi:hypothetical protein
MQLCYDYIFQLKLLTIIIGEGGGHMFLKTVDSTTFWGLGLQIYNKFTT